MTQHKHFPTRIRYEYVEEEQAKLHTAHGVWGGINPHGEIELNFYAESDKAPTFSERNVAEDGTLGPEMVPDDEGVRVITRAIHTKILLNHRTAHAVREWLEEKIDSLEMDEASLFLDDDDTGTEQ